MNRIEIIDGYDLGLAERTGIYVIQETDLTIIETGPSASFQHIQSGLESLGYTLADVRNIILTHIHLDHGGGTGQLLKHCPNATVYVHSKGFRHLADPSRLIQGAKFVYQEQFESLFEPIFPVSEQKMIAVTEGDTLQIGENCILRFWDTPGHANHHLAIYDPVSNGMFVGDTIGIRYPQLVKEGISFYLPSTSPNQFNPEAMLAAVNRMEQKSLDYIYFGHYGATSEVNHVYENMRKWIPIFVNEAIEIVKNGKTAKQLEENLLRHVQCTLNEHGILENHPVYDIIAVDLKVSALGLLDYVQKNN